MNKQEILDSFFKGRVGVLATMHHKEKVIAPILEKELGIEVIVPENFNTDRFGTFTREIDRAGNQLEAAKRKAEHAMSVTGKTLAFASEGSFGPHPLFSFVPFNREIIVLVDKKHHLEIIGESQTTDTNYAQKTIKTFQEAYEFCKEAGFPEHAVIIKVNESTKDLSEIVKGITTKEKLSEAVKKMLQKSQNGEVFIETDMRALYNPTRMKNIEKAAHDLIEKINNVCPSCFVPGFELTERKPGLLCGGCGFPTSLIRADVYMCKKCGETEEKLYPQGKKTADPSQCGFCNP
ncbi:DUF6671 family protein [Bacillus taeanensis]|uniref:DUF6671 domain-containing protein n=1 Tax=Bacillus taeanensis TaxID=273032 RepID=A0A366XPH2_9BACI|nr:DUF6671 family protein [Bacillus taeanensis]RBW67418.1 hypothetical protein DS031_22390 [Bacillus taeanensis]